MVAPEHVIIDATESPLIEDAPPETSTGRKRKVRPVWWGIAALAVATGYFTLSGSEYLFTFNLCMLAIFGAVSLDLLKGTAGMVSTGNAAFMAVGAYTAVFVEHVGLPFPSGVILAAGTAAVAGLIIGSPAVRLRGMQLFLATMAGHFLVVHLALEYQKKSASGSGVGFFLTPLYTSKGLEGAQVYWAWTLLVLVALLLLGATRLVRERSGRAFRMIRDHEVVAHTLGIRVTRYKMLAFVMSSAVIGVEGALMAHFNGTVSAESFTFALAVTYVVMVIVGGLDSIAGAVIGAFTVTSLPVILPKVLTGVLGREQAVAKGPALTSIFYGLMVIGFIISSPNGIIGLVRKARDCILDRRGGSTERDASL